VPRARISSVKIAIMGSGGVGGYFGGRLAAAGYDVTFIARGAHLEAMRRDGLRVESANGSFHTAVQATSDPAEVGPVDYVCIAVKLWDTEAAARAAVPMVGPRTTVVSFQNGVEKEDVLRQVFPAPNLIGGVSYIAAVIGQPGVIAHTGTMARLVFGEFDGRRSERVMSLLEACRHAGIEAEVPENIEVAIWRKFTFLVGLSATTTATRQPIGVVRSVPRSRQLLIDIVGEAWQVGRARGVPLTDALYQEGLAHLDRLPHEMTSSMHQDLKRGNRLEVPWLSGAVVRLGQELGVATPLNRAIWDVLAPYQDGQGQPLPTVAAL
jgi:2-dehydropantoate 2-reductase